MAGGDGLMTRLPEHFRLDHLQEDFNLATDEDMDTSRRFRMIQLREKEVPSFRNQVVPAFDREIGDDIFLVSVG